MVNENCYVLHSYRYSLMHITLFPDDPGTPVFLPYGRMQLDSMETVGDDVTFSIPPIDIGIPFFSTVHIEEDLHVSLTHFYWQKRLSSLLHNAHPTRYCFCWHICTPFYCSCDFLCRYPLMGSLRLESHLQIFEMKTFPQDFLCFKMQLLLPCGLI